MAPRTTAGSSWRFSASSRRLQTDLERVAPKTSTISPIVMVASTPARRDYHITLLSSNQPVRLLPQVARLQLSVASKNAQQCSGERSALSTALSSVIVRAMTAGGANAGPEGALTAIPPSFLAQNGDSKYRLFTVILPYHNTDPLPVARSTSSRTHAAHAAYSTTQSLPVPQSRRRVRMQATADSRPSRQQQHGTQQRCERLSIPCGTRESRESETRAGPADEETDAAPN